jgi:predicted GNAT family N-acyltransferase
MIESDFYVEPASWDIDRDAIAAIRTEVFIHEQRVPEDEEFDDDDPSASHFLARDNDGVVLGTARLTKGGRIGRMAVLKAWRGRGVGEALLRNCIEVARLGSLPEITLAAQTHAIGFYQRQGFEAYGDEFDEVEIPHRWMKLVLGDSGVGPLERSIREPDPLPINERLEIDRTAALRSTTLTLLKACRNELAIWSGDLDAAVLDDDEALEEIKQIAVAAPRPVIRILLMDSARAVKNDHRLLKLAQRLSTVIRIRRPARQHQEYLGAFVVADRQHSIFREFNDQAKGLLQPFDRLAARRLMEQFDEAWEQSEPDPDLQRLDL